MNKQTLTELEFLNERVKYEKRQFYSKGLRLLPGIATLTTCSLANNHFGIAIGMATTLGGLALTENNIYKAKKYIKKHVK